MVWPRTVFELTLILLKSHDADKASVELAVELLVTLGESSPKYMKKVEGYLQSIVNIALNLMSSGLVKDFGFRNDLETQLAGGHEEDEIAEIADMYMAQLPEGDAHLLWIATNYSVEYCSVCVGGLLLFEVYLHFLGRRQCECP
jgi:hypothetical protein